MLIVCSRAARAGLVFPNILSSYFASIFSKQRISATSIKICRTGDISTPFYSTILAPATLKNSMIKESRLKEWDRQILETRKGLPSRKGMRTSVGSQFEQELKSPSCTKNLFTDVVVDEFSDSELNFFGRPAWHLREAIKEVKSTHNQYTLGLCNQTEDNISPISIEKSTKDPNNGDFIHEEPDLDAPERDISDSVELNDLGTNINGLVVKLLEISTLFKSSGTDEQVSGDETIRIQLEDMKERLKSLEETFGSLPIYFYEEKSIAQQQAKDLNAILWNICRKASNEKDRINLMIAKICYNLLISAIPPNIETYNILLHEFAILECYDFAEQVLHSFWFSKLRPNKRTIELILLHYKVTKNKDGLTLMVRMMRGANGNLMQSSTYAKKYLTNYISIDGPQKKLQNFNPHDPVIRRGMKWRKLFFRSGYLYRKSPRDKHVFDALITAHFELKGLRPAIRYISAAIREGSNVKESTLCMIIDFCIKRADFTSGLELLIIILSQWTVSGYCMQIQLSPIARFHIYRLLFFCGVNPNKGVHGHLPPRIMKYTEGMIVREIEFPKEALRKMLYLMKLHYLEEKLNRNIKLIEELNTILEVTKSLSTIFYDHQRFDEAFQIIDDFIENEKNIIDDSSILSNSKSGFQLRILGLRANIANSYSKMEEITTSLIMLRIQICASKLNEMARRVSRRSRTDFRMHHIRKLSMNLSVLHMQLQVERHLNCWWIRRLGLVSCLSRSATQRKRLNLIIQILTNIESKTKILSDEYIQIENSFGDDHIVKDVTSNHDAIKTNVRQMSEI